MLPDAVNWKATTFQDKQSLRNLCSTVWHKTAIQRFAVGTDDLMLMMEEQALKGSKKGCMKTVVTVINGLGRDTAVPDPLNFVRKQLRSLRSCAKRDNTCVLAAGVNACCAESSADCSSKLQLNCAGQCIQACRSYLLAYTA
jgi:hypothetical protein